MKKLFLLIVLLAVAIALSGCVQPPSPVCGNGICEVGENSTNCPEDCSTEPPSTETHLECQNQACAEVQGVGPDQCTGDVECQTSQICNETEEGKISCIDGDSYICTYRKEGTSKAEFYWQKTMDCQQGCSNGRCNEETMYSCGGEIRNGVCYNKGFVPLQQLDKEYSDPFILLSFEYPETGFGIGDIITVNTILQNKTGEQMLINYHYDVKELSQKISSDLLTDDSASKANPISLNLQPYETKTFTSTFRIQEPVPSFIQRYLLGFDLRIPAKGVVALLNLPVTDIDPVEDYLVCNGKKFPMVDLYGGYYESKCCDNVFYPGFSCCADSECLEGKCIDGKCINKESILQKNIAKGNKKVLVILFSKDEADTSPCLVRNTQEQLEGVEEYFDAMAERYLNQPSDFLNFEWEVYGKFNSALLNLSEEEVASSTGGVSVAEAAAEYCGLDYQSFDEYIVISREYSTFWCNLAGGDCSTGFVFLSGKRSTTTAHELAHEFGCWDIYNNTGADLQWRGELMAAGREDISSDDVPLSEMPGLQVCRGEMGWADLDGDGIAEILEIE